jgi:tRNA A-37 threonylcarbamoyl transferase component Bud32
VEEIPLRTRVTEGLVRVGDTVRRPAVSPAALDLLRHLEAVGFDGAPRALGFDDQGRAVLSWIPGDVPWDLDGGAASNEQLAAVGALIRRFHDATGGTALAGDAEVVCHNDLSPDNTVYRSGKPVALIDFDDAAPGRRLDDVGYAAWLYLDLTRASLPPAAQVPRLHAFAGGYGVAADATLVAAIAEAQHRNIEGIERTLREPPPHVKLDYLRHALEWNRGEAEWFESVRSELL